MAGEVMVGENSLTRRWVRVLRLMRMGSPVMRDEVLRYVPGEVDDEDITICRWVEDGVKIHHADVFWRLRDALTVTIGEEKVDAVGWFIRPQTVGLAVDCAASLFRMRFGRWPSAAGMARLPKRAPAMAPLTGVVDSRVGELLQPPAGGVRFMEIGWVPDGFVVAGDFPSPQPCSEGDGQEEKSVLRGGEHE